MGKSIIKANDNLSLMKAVSEDRLTAIEAKTLLNYTDRFGPIIRKGTRIRRASDGTLAVECWLSNHLRWSELQFIDVPEITLK